MALLWSYSSPRKARCWREAKSRPAPPATCAAPSSASPPLERDERTRAATRWGEQLSDTETFSCEMFFMEPLVPVALRPIRNAELSSETATTRTRVRQSRAAATQSAKVCQAGAHSRERSHVGNCTDKLCRIRTAEQQVSGPREMFLWRLVAVGTVRSREAGISSRSRRSPSVPGYASRCPRRFPIRCSCHLETRQRSRTPLALANLLDCRGVAEEVEEEGWGEGVELGEGSATLGPQRLSRSSTSAIAAAPPEAAAAQIAS